MSPHWRLALRSATWMVLLAALIGVAIIYFYGAAHAGGFVYGVGVGILSFVSTALTVSLLTGGRSMAVGMMIGAASFAARCGFAAATLGVPAYLGLWPVVPMLVGFAGVYLAENVVLWAGVPKTMSYPSERRNAGRSVGDGVERKVEA